MGDHAVKSESPPEEKCCPYGDECYQKSFDNYPADHECYLKTFPVGFRFKPNDVELISDYLSKRIRSQPLLPNIIREVSLYDSTPAQLTDMYKEYAVDGLEWYFFTNRERKYPNGDRPRRDVGDDEGYWKATGNPDPIKKGNMTIGSKRTLVYYEWKPKTESSPSKEKESTKTDFKMHEYVLDVPPKTAQHPDSTNTEHATEQDRKGKAVSTAKAFTDVALCKIYWNPGKSKKRTVAEAATESSTAPSSEDSISPTVLAVQNIHNEAFVDPFPAFVDPFPYFGNCLTLAEENEYFGRELKEENQTHDFFNNLTGMDPNDPDFYDCDAQQLLTDQQLSSINCNRTNIPVDTKPQLSRQQKRQQEKKQQQRK